MGRWKRRDCIGLKKDPKAPNNRRVHLDMNALQTTEVGSTVMLVGPNGSRPVKVSKIEAWGDRVVTMPSGKRVWFDASGRSARTELTIMTVDQYLTSAQ